MSECFGSTEELWEKCASDLLVFASVLAGPSDAEDVVADVMTRLVAITTGTPSNRQLTKRYARRAVLNEVRMRHRKRLRREAREWAATRTQLPEPVELLSDPEVIEAVRSLSVMQRAVIFLTYWHDLDTGTVGAELGIASGTVKRHLARARRKLREVL